MKITLDIERIHCPNCSKYFGRTEKTEYSVDAEMNIRLYDNGHYTCPNCEKTIRVECSSQVKVSIA